MRISIKIFSPIVVGDDEGRFCIGTENIELTRWGFSGGSYSPGIRIDKMLNLC